MTQPTNKKSVLLVVTLTAFCIPFMWSAINVALPPIAEELHMNAIQMAWIVSSFTVASVITILPFGRLADIYGRKRIFAWGVIGFTVTSFILMFSNSVLFIMAFRVLQGIAGAMLFATGAAILTSVFPLGERGRALGIYTGTVFVGLALGPSIGGVLTYQLGWRSIFAVTVILGLIGIILLYTRLKDDWADARGEKFDIVGAVIFSVMMFAIVYGFSSLPDAYGYWMILIGALGMVAFVRYEMRTGSPLINVDLYRNNRTFTFSSLATLINFSAAFSVTVLISLYLQYIEGFTPQNAGLVLLTYPVIMALISPAAGRLSDRFHPSVVAAVGMAIATISMIMFVFLDENTSLLYYVVGLVVLGLGAGLFSSPNTNAVMSSVKKRYYGIAAAVVATMRHTGVVFSMGLIMILFSIYMGRVPITPEYYGLFQKSVTTTFIVSSVISFIGIFVSLTRSKLNSAGDGE